MILKSDSMSFSTTTNTKVYGQTKAFLTDNVTLNFTCRTVYILFYFFKRNMNHIHYFFYE